MNWADIKIALSDFFTPAELIELLDIDTEELIYMLEDCPFGTVFTEEVLTELQEIMQTGED